MPSSPPDSVVIDAAFQATAFEALEVEVPSAHVQLRPHDDDHVQVRGYVPDTDPDTAGTLFERKEISTHQSSSRLHVHGSALSGGVEEWRWQRAHPTAVHFEIRLPPDLDVLTETPGGSVDAAHLAGALEFATMGGSVQTHQLTGPLDVRGGAGALHITEYEGPSLDLHWSAGAVTLKAISGPSTTLRAASAPTTVEGLGGPADLLVQGASLTLRDVDGPCEAEVRGGSLTYSGTPSDETTLQTVGGELHTHLPSAQAATLTLTGAQVALDDAFAFEGERTDHRIEGRLNGGGPSLRVRAVQGRAHCTADDQ